MKTLEKLLTENRMPHDLPSEENPGNGLRGLKDLCDDHITKDTVMAEIGCFLGASTELFAMHCKKIYAVDPWGLITSDYESTNHIPNFKIYGGGDEVQRAFEQRMAPYDNVETMRAFSADAAKEFEDESLDLVYIAGDHARKQVLADLLAWYPKIKSGGVLSGHDLNNHHVRKGIEMWRYETSVVWQKQPRRGRGYIDGSWRILKL